MQSPTPKTVDDTLRRIARVSEHPRTLAKELICQHRIPPRLTQSQIDGGYDDEERRRRFVGAAVRFQRRSLWRRLLFWR